MNQKERIEIERIISELQDLADVGKPQPTRKRVIKQGPKPKLAGSGPQWDSKGNPVYKKRKGLTTGG